MVPMGTRVYIVLNSLGCTYNLSNLECKVGWGVVFHLPWPCQTQLPKQAPIGTGKSPMDAL